MFQSMDLQLLAAAMAAPPMNTTVPAKHLDQKDEKEIGKLKWRIKETLGGMKADLQIVLEEEVLLNQVLYKIHNRFHNDRGYKDLRMFDKTVRKLLAHHYVQKLENLLSFLTSPLTSLPTRAMAQHSALQVYGAAALLHRLLALATNSGLLAVQRLNLGHFWGVGAQQLACVARLWLVARHLLASLQVAYCPLVSLLALLPGEEDVLKVPSSLDAFLPEDLVGGMEVVEEKVEEVEMVEKRAASVDSFLDIGVPVKRLETVEPVAVEVKPKDSLSDIHSLDELKIFLEAETKLRKISKKTCMTRNLKQDTWKRLRADILKAVNVKTPNKSLKLCRKIFRSALANHAS